MWLLIAFIAVPLIEIALFIQVGGLLGLWPTLVIVILTAVAGTYLVKRQGIAVLNELKQSFHSGPNPAEPIAHGALILFSGALLLTPGFFTDAVGFSLLIPAVRLAILNYGREKLTNSPKFQFHSSTHPTYPQDVTIETEYKDISDSASPKETPSGWTKDLNRH
jgi:UPF0716 protein FxsA